MKKSGQSAAYFFKHGGEFFSAVRLYYVGVIILRYIPQTDLAVEARELATANSGELTGVTAETSRRAGAAITELNIVDAAGEKAMNRPKGKYFTVELKEPPQESDENFEEVVGAIGDLIAGLIPNGDVLVAGLGNLGVTPDALGPKAAARVLVTRHITAAGGPGADLFRPVTVVQPGVLGQTGVESAEVVGGVAKSVRPAAIIAIDALAARRLDRLGCTVQITDTGIQPGAGIGNHRQELTKGTLGVPVIGIGVPTVISAATLIGDAVSELTEEPSSGPPLTKYADLFVTPRDIDTIIDRMSALIGFSINHALQKDLSVEDMRYYGC
ncbi:Germination protease [bioreactor metagenome]|uniref:Germination protease n=1 Tax=bioreactor metagenome TaxID=1076179 RepID=A0A644XWR3_9ZZZZ